MMNKYVGSFCRRIVQPYLFKKQNRFIKNCFKLNYQVIDYNKNNLLFDNNDIISSLIYKDESWNSIKYIYNLMWNDLFRLSFLQYNSSEIFEDNFCFNDKVYFGENEIFCKSSKKNNDWVFLLINKKLNDNYLVEFSAILSFENTEFQFAFNYNSVGLRYRFNLVDNKVLSFEVVYNGFFHNKIFSIPLSLEMNVLYNFKIAVKNYTYSFILDDKNLLSISDEKRIIKGGMPVFILWDSKNSNIEVKYTNINIYNI